ncbi:MAG: hypothetical protein AAFY72_11260, partial [Cyanobacteria bacterium J06649_4]
KRADISNEVFSALPNILCFVKSLEIPEPFGTIALFGHAGTNAIAMVVTGITGTVLMDEATKALNAAEAAT